MKGRIPNCRSFFPPMILLYTWRSHETHASSGSIIYKQEISHRTLPPASTRALLESSRPCTSSHPSRERKGRSPIHFSVQFHTFHVHCAFHNHDLFLRRCFLPRTGRF